MFKKLLLVLFCLSIPELALSCPILKTANPKVGSEVGADINKVELEFSSVIYPEKSTITVTDINGKNYASGKAYGKTGDGNFIATKVADLSPGKYKVSWNVFCDCGELTPGDFKFTVQ